MSPSSAHFIRKHSLACCSRSCIIAVCMLGSIRALALLCGICSRASQLLLQLLDAVFKVGLGGCSNTGGILLQVYVSPWCLNAQH